MYAEDCFNVRHVTSAWLGEYVLGYDVTSMEWRRSLSRTVIELAIYVAMAAVMAVAYLIIWRQRLLSKWQMTFFTGGYLFYGIATFASASRNIGDWYAKVGTWLFEHLAAAYSLPWQGSDIIHYQDPLGFWWMDYVIEESVELLAASLLASAGIYLFSHSPDEETHSRIAQVGH
ncbi:hypothetical protein [Alkalimonas sp.]|uniref:hypothetical protein n=1 Tax=Alkalimonas sp. TaxID=1872453 RepID=UPI00263B3201|nr:hypothetical protein [Alkalimonas sp.]MCC5827328.1 hypothetical protein [Alkalimonas sp.]